MSRMTKRQTTLAEFSPLMLLIARESRKLSQTALAKVAGVTQAAISHYESGQHTPSDEIVTRLAGCLAYPPSLLYQTVRFQQLPLTFFRKKAKVGVTQVNAIRARVNLYRMRIEVLLRAGEPIDPRIALADLAKDALSPAKAAQRLRVYWNVPPGPIANLTEVIERAGVLVVPFDFGTASVDGLSIWEPNDTLPPMIFANPSVSPDRWRMTLAHELGHIVCHHHLNLPSEDKAMEQEAFDFAQEFLMPAKEIWGHLGFLSLVNLAALKRHWRVSMRALLKRAEALNRISDRHARRLWMQLSRDGTTEPVEIAPEAATALKHIVERHLLDLGYTERSLSQALHESTDELRSDFGLAANHLRLA